MKTVGEVLSQARKKKRISISSLSGKTKIKERFLRAIEEERWSELPDFAVTQGFVRNFAKTVGVDEKFAAALLRRDFPQAPTKKGRFPEIKVGEPPVFWTPKTTIFVISLLIVGIIGIYLTRQYLIFAAPPPLEILQPRQNEIINGITLEVKGKTNPEAQVLVNGSPVLVDEKGIFQTKLTLSAGEQKVIIEAVSRSGKRTEKEVVIEVKPL